MRSVACFYPNHLAWHNSNPKAPFYFTHRLCGRAGEESGGSRGGVMGSGMSRRLGSVDMDHRESASATPRRIYEDDQRRLVHSVPR